LKPERGGKGQTLLRHNQINHKQTRAGSQVTCCLKSEIGTLSRPIAKINWVQRARRLSPIHHHHRSTIMVSNPFQCLTLSLLILPPLLLTTYFFANFPHPPEPPPLHPSLASLPSSSESWNIYPENFYEGGDYVTFPYGRVGAVLFNRLPGGGLTCARERRCDIG
jgi:hypothetical protein